MSMAGFLRLLTERSHIEVASFEPELDLSDVDKVLQETADQLATELAYNPPPFVSSAATWGARILYCSCQFLAYGQPDLPFLQSVLCEKYPQTPSPAVCWSVDISLRFLPDLIRLARGLSHDHPFVTSLLTVARQWPLSSVGVRDIGPVDVQAFWGNPCLQQLYVDRLIERQDDQRLMDPTVRQAVRAAVGIYPELVGTLADFLKETSST
jgi:MoxR-vWA-beta-propeller ternary system domain bpX4